MRDYIEIGSSPLEEDCAQVGAQDYRERSRAELQAFKQMLEQQWPEGSFGIKWFPHDFGSYGEVVAYFDDERSADIAFEVECNTPLVWSDMALSYLASKGF